MIRFAAFIVGAILTFSGTAIAGKQMREADYRTMFCKGFEQEVRLERQSIADCVSSTHAIEVEWADNWKEGVGQALSYATETALIPGIILICRRDQSHCLSSSLYVQETFSAYGIEATVWECTTAERALSSCVEKWVCKGGSCP